MSVTSKKVKDNNRSRAWYHKNKVEIKRKRDMPEAKLLKKEYDAERAIRHPNLREKKRLVSEEWYKNNVIRKSEYNLMQKYGITHKIKEEMRVAQDNQCDCCKISFDHESLHKFNIPACRIICIDHDHSYEEGDPEGIRALVCCFCNMNALTKLSVEQWMNGNAKSYYDRRIKPVAENFSNRERVKTDDNE